MFLEKSLLKKQHFTTGILRRLFGNRLRMLYIIILTIRAFYDIHSKMVNKNRLRMLYIIKFMAGFIKNHLNSFGLKQNAVPFCAETLTLNQHGLAFHDSRVFPHHSTLFLSSPLHSLSFFLFLSQWVNHGFFGGENHTSGHEYKVNDLL